MNDAVDCTLDPARKPQSGRLMAWDTMAVLMAAYESSERDGAFVDVSEYVQAREFRGSGNSSGLQFGAVFQRVT